MQFPCSRVGEGVGLLKTLLSLLTDLSEAAGLRCLW